jgi:peptidoglycan DL-endopeptidase CwlO
VNFTARVTSRAFDVGSAPSIRRSLRIVALGLASVALSLLGVFPASLPAAAEPPPMTVAQARNLIKQLQNDAAGIDQQYTDVQEQIKEGRAQLRLKQADAQAQTKKVERLKLQASQIALAQFQNRSLDTAAHLVVTPDIEGFLSQISTVQKVSENQNARLQDYQQAQANLAALQNSAETELVTLGEKEKQLQALAAASDNKLDQAKKVLAKLTAAQQKQLAEAEKKAAAKANAEALAATKEPAKTNGRAATKASPKANAESRAATKAPPSTRSSSTGSSKGANALAYAKAQLGEPYARSGAGPSSWDCSGLTMMAWGSVGVSLPHSSRQQFSRGQSVAKSDLRSGDLVFFYSDISHVGLYAGNGQVIHAPRPGKSVEYIKMSYMPYAGARRPG